MPDGSTKSASSAVVPLRGQIWWARFDRGVGGEIRRTRPAVIVSVDEANTALNRVQALPVTTRIDRVFPSEALVVVRDLPCKAMADQLDTLDKTRLLSMVGRVSADEMHAIERALRNQLGLQPR